MPGQTDGDSAFWLGMTKENAPLPRRLVTDYTELPAGFHKLAVAALGPDAPHSRYRSSP